MAQAKQKKKESPAAFGAAPGGSPRQGGLVVSVCVLLAFACCAVYGRTLWQDFVNYDDPLYVTDNTAVQQGLSWAGVVWAFTTNRALYMHPLTWLSHMADCSLYGLHPWGHHLTNLILHTADSILLFLVFARMTRRLWPSALVAALFAVHPLHVESVAWIAERKDVLSMLFWTACLGAYAWHRERPGLGRYLAVVFMFLLGLLSKPMVVTLPFVLLLLDYWPLEQMDRAAATGVLAKKAARLAVEKAPLFLITAAFSVITFTMQAQGNNLSFGEKVSLPARCANAVVVYVIYLVKTVWPTGLAAYYPHPLTRPAWQVAGAAVILVSITLLCLREARRRPYLIVGWLWYLGTLVPVIELVQAGSFSHADRYTYIPLIGIFIMFAWGLADLAAALHAPRRVLAASTVAALVLLAGCAAVQAGYWRNGETLFRHAIDAGYPSSAAYNNLGVLAMKDGRYDASRASLSKALEMDPDYVDGLNNMSALNIKQHRYEEARACLARVLAKHPDQVDALTNLGKMDLDEGRYDEAVTCLTRALEIKPEHVEALNNMGVLAIKQGRHDEARTWLARVLKLNPRQADAFSNLGMVDLAEGHQDDARTHLTEALRLKPDHAQALCNLGVLDMNQGRDDEAAAWLKKAADLDPNYADAVNKLGALAAKQGRYEEALRQLGRALEMDPQCAEARNSLAWLHATCRDARFRDGKKAVEYALQALEQSKSAWYCLDTLAAAYGADGQFALAVETQEKAVAVLGQAEGMAAAEKQRNMDDIEKRLALYKKGTAYIDETQPATR